MPSPSEILVGLAAAPAKLVKKGTQLETPGMIKDIWDVDWAEQAAFLLLWSFRLLSKGLDKYMAIAAVYRRGDLAVAIPINDPVQLAQAEQLARQDRAENTHAGTRDGKGFTLEGFWAFDPGAIQGYVPTDEVDSGLGHLYSEEKFSVQPARFMPHPHWTYMGKPPRERPAIAFSLSDEEQEALKRMVMYTKVFLTADL